MQITRDNYSQYSQMIHQMFGKVNSNDPMAQCDYGNFSLRFKPVDIKFQKPNWSEIPTKRSKPAMSEEEFTEAIINVKMDWISMLQQMAQAYLGNPQTYLQYLDCGKLISALEKWGSKADK